MLKIIIPLILILLLIFASKAYYDTNSIELKHYQIENSSLGEVLKGLKVAHLSDLHIKTIGIKEKKILEILKEEKPDLIFITGDLISFKGAYEPVTSFLQQLKPPIGVYAVLGNTEYSNENGSCTLCHKEKSRSLNENQNVVFLRNSSVPLRVNGQILNIIGVDDPVDEKSDLKTALKGANSKNPSILLAHSPEIFEEASNYGFDFLFCGHTHGGQIFATKYLRKIFPLDPALEFLEGFFQKGRVLMYVSRGIGTSYLPFRLGVKPEITFFNFSSNLTNQTNQNNQANLFTATLQPRSTAARFSWSISNTPPITVFTGFNLSSLMMTFNILNIFDSIGLIGTQQRNTSAPQHYTTTAQQHSNTGAQEILFDFESESDLQELNWECHKWFELSDANVTSGKHSLRVILPPGQYPGISFGEIKKDWSKGNYLKMDIFNPLDEDFKFHIRIDDHKSGWDYANRFDINFDLKPGMNQLSIRTESIRTNIHHRPLNLKKIRRMMVFIANNPKERNIYIDNIRLE